MFNSGRKETRILRGKWVLWIPLSSLVMTVKWRIGFIWSQKKVMWLKRKSFSPHLTLFPSQLQQEIHVCSYKSALQKSGAKQKEAQAKVGSLYQVMQVDSSCLSPKKLMADLECDNAGIILEGAKIENPLLYCTWRSPQVDLSFCHSR